MLRFDQVAVTMASGTNLMSADAWMAIPTLEQFDLISEGRVEFLHGEQRVKATDAVRSMLGD